MRRHIAPDDPLPPRPDQQLAGLPMFGGAPKPWDRPAFPHVAPPAARVTDPEPSHIAARTAFADAQQQNRMIVAGLSVLAPLCVTSYGLADRLNAGLEVEPGEGWDHVMISRRISKLRDAGLVYTFDGRQGRPLALSTDGGEHAPCALMCAADHGRPLGTPVADDTPFERRRAS